MNTSRRNVLSLAAAAMCSSPLASWADTYPDRHITLIVPFTAGPADSLMRALADSAGRTLGKPVVVENRPGAGGTTAPVAMAKTAKPDGYTISLFSGSILRYPHMNNVDWNPVDDFTYIIGVTSDALAIHVGTASPFKSFQDMVSWAKENPGKLTYGTPGVGTTMHVGMESLLKRLGVKATHIPYKGSAEVIRSLLAGETMVSIDLAGGMYPYVSAGRARYLVQFNNEPASFMKDIPTIGESVKGFELSISSLGIVGPKGMPDAIVQKLHAAFTEALDQPSMTKLLDDLKKDRWHQPPSAYRAWAGRTFALEKDMVYSANLQAK